MRPPFDRIAIDGRAADLPFVRSFLGRVPPELPVSVLAPDAPKPTGRRTVYLCVEPGAFLKPCPCTPGVVRCGYWVMSLGFQCPFACTYCFLRFYAPDEPLTLYANLENARAEFLAASAEFPGPVRLGTGEFTDSLALDPWTRHSEWLRELVSARPGVLLELKTKSDRIDLLLEGSPAPNVVVAWSLNPPERIDADEPGAASLGSRLAAASAVARAGYSVAFHFDPIVLEGEWRRDYAEVVRALFEAVDPRRVAWISLGTLRFPGRFLDQWGRKLRGRRTFFSEFVSGPDGKLRYFGPLRREAYRFVSSELRRRGGDALKIYLCMEPEWMWGRGLGWRPDDSEVSEYLTILSPGRSCGAGDTP